jgi:hypothetical protein
VDIFEGPVDPTFQTQIHDFNPGITAAGLFWTEAIDDDAVRAAAGAGRAQLTFEGLQVPDFGSIPASLTHQPPIGTGTLDVELVWHAGGERFTTSDRANTFRYSAVPGPATISFHVRSGSFDYQSASEAQTTVFAAVGHERNGSFFNA